MKIKLIFFAVCAVIMCSSLLLPTNSYAQACGALERALNTANQQMEINESLLRGATNQLTEFYNQREAFSQAHPGLPWPPELSESELAKRRKAFHDARALVQAMQITIESIEAQIEECHNALNCDQAGTPDIPR